METGRANTVLVFDQGDNVTAAVSTVIAKTIKKNAGEEIIFRGPARFTERTEKHILEVIMPVADTIFKALGLSNKDFEISIVNLEEASVKDIGLQISGFSADVPILLAILSAGLGMEVSENLISTGHIASTDGDIRMVKDIQKKLAAACANGSIQRFVYPAINQDEIFNGLSPAEKENVSGAFSKYKGNVKTAAIRDISELIQTVFSEEQVVLASLKHGFFKTCTHYASRGTHLGKAVNFFTENNSKRFWAVLEEKLLRALSESARELMQAFAAFHIKQNTYPEKAGSKLLQLVYSIPPETRSLKIDFPILTISECIKLSQFARESDQEDVLLLYRASFEKENRQRKMPSISKGLNEENDIDSGSSKLESILSEINTDALSQTIGQPIDSARAAYIMDSVVAESNTAFNDTITAFYIHLLRHTRNVLEPIDLNAAGAEAFALLERTFQKKGGVRTALAEAISATNGGLRRILDDITAQFKHEQLEMHVNRVLKLVLDPLDWNGKVELIRAILKRLEHQLPQDILSQPPEQYAAHYDVIVRAYINSMDQIKSIIRSF